MILALLLQANPGTIETVIIGVSSAVVAAGINYLTSSRSNAKFQGSIQATIEAKFDETSSKFKELRTEQDQQWSKINDVTALVSQMRGYEQGRKDALEQMNKHARGHSAS